MSKDKPPIVSGGEDFSVWQEPTNRYVSKNGVYLASTYILKSIVKKEKIKQASIIHNIPENFPYHLQGMVHCATFEQPLDDKKSTIEDRDSVREQITSKPIEIEPTGYYFPSIYQINGLFFAIDAKIEYIQKTDTFEPSRIRNYWIKSNIRFIPEESFTQDLFVTGGK